MTFIHTVSVLNGASWLRFTSLVTYSSKHQTVGGVCLWYLIVEYTFPAENISEYKGMGCTGSLDCHVHSTGHRPSDEAVDLLDTVLGMACCHRGQQDKGQGLHQ